MLGPLNSVRRRLARGFTLVELIVVMLIAGVLLAIAVPGLYDFILLQRLKGINAQLVTDLQYARSEAAARNQYARVGIGATGDTMTCYVVFISTANSRRCTCLTSATATCAEGAEAIKTVRLPRSDRVVLRIPPGQASGFAFDHVSGGIVSTPSDRASVPLAGYTIESYLSNDTSLVLRNVIGQAGRVSVCAPDSGAVGVGACS